MNGVHDLGGLNCFGPVIREADEPVFHDDWERRVFATLFLSGLDTIDASRSAIERADPLNYLRTTYYEHWLAGLELLIEEHDVANRAPTDETFQADMVEPMIYAGSPATRDTDNFQPRFAVGDRVRARNINPEGHTRLPRYVRGHTGVVAIIHGNHVYPDASAAGEPDAAEPLYCVRFNSQDLWGESGRKGDTVAVDLWESYLEEAD